MKTLPLAGCLIALAVFAPAARAATNAFDVASNYSGLSSYLNVNGGSGWSSSFTNSSTYSGGNPNEFLASAGQIDTSALSFGLTGDTITRYFGGPGNYNSLNADQFFRFRLLPGNVPQGGSFAMSVHNGFNISTGVSLSYSTSNPDYLFSVMTYSGINPSSQSTDTGIPFSTTPLTITFSQSGGLFSLTARSDSGPSATITNVYTGYADGISLYAYNGATLYFNNFAVVPEPSSWTTLALGSAAGIGWLLARRRAQGKKA